MATPLIFTIYSNQITNLSNTVYNAIERGATSMVKYLVNDYKISLEPLSIFTAVRSMYTNLLEFLFIKQASQT